MKDPTSDYAGRGISAHNIPSLIALLALVFCWTRMRGNKGVGRGEGEGRRGGKKRGGGGGGEVKGRVGTERTAGYMSLLLFDAHHYLTPTPI